MEFITLKLENLGKYVESENQIYLSSRITQENNI